MLDPPLAPSPAETAAHDLETSSLFWKAETIQRGKQTIYGNAWPKDFAAVAGCAARHPHII